MKYILTIIVCLVAIFGHAQCKDCNSLEEALKSPKKVKTLKISPWTDNKITLDTLPPSIGLLVNAKVIYLSGHEFNTIPKEIGQLQNLKELSFAQCGLTEIPDEIYELKNLNELILLSNDFDEAYADEIRKKVKQNMPRTKLLID